jgi:hypothetical protein
LFDTTFTSTGFTDSTSRRFTDQQNNGYQVSANINYTEPLSQNSQLQFTTIPPIQKAGQTRKPINMKQLPGKYSVFNPALSSKFDNSVSGQNGGIGYRYGTRDNQLSFGLNYQRTALNSEQDFPRDLRVSKTFSNFLPNAMLRFKTQCEKQYPFYVPGQYQPTICNAVAGCI